MIELILTAAASLATGLVGLTLWLIKKNAMRVEDTYRKHEVNQLIDLKLGTIQTELSSLKATDARLEAHLTRLEHKIDKLIEKLN